MSDSQFFRAQTAPLRSSSPTKRTITRNIAEGLRKRYASRHVDHPMEPLILCERKGQIKEIVRYIRRAKKAFEKKHDCVVRSDAHLWMGAIYSYKKPLKEVMKSWEEIDKLLDWIDANIKRSDDRYGDQHYGSLAHIDEARFHIHCWVVAKEIDGKFTLGDAHPGLVSERLYLPPLERKPAYKEAMSCEQFCYWMDVSRHFGIERLSPNPQPRLSYKIAIKKREIEEKAEAKRKYEEEEKQILALQLKQQRGLKL